MDKAETVERVLDSMRDVFDPEIPVNIVDLGLVYEVNLNDEGHAHILMSLTSMGCPAQDNIEADSITAALRVPQVKNAEVEITFNPPWTPEKMSEDGKKLMRMYGFNL